MMKNILVIDDGNNSSINYKKTVINNNNQIFINFDEAVDIFNEEQEGLFRYDTRKCITLILSDNTEISLHEYTGNQEVRFLKITNELLAANNGNIIIATNKKHYIRENIKWQDRFSEIHAIDKYNKLPVDKRVNGMLSELDGYWNCQEITRKHRKHADIYGNIPAIKCCNALKINNKGGKYNGYLPACGQLMFIWRNKDLINAIFGYIGSEPIYYASHNYWSSTEDGASHVYILSNFEIPNISFKNSSYGMYMLPLFKQMK